MTESVILLILTEITNEHIIICVENGRQIIAVELIP